MSLSYYADQLSTPKQFNVNERCMLSTQNLKLLNQPSTKFRFRYIRPLKNNNKTSQAYKVNLPLNSKVHRVSYIRLLK